MDQGSQQYDWLVTIVKEFGVATVLLLGGIFFCKKAFERWIIPWIDQLVKSHLALVDSLRGFLTRSSDSLEKMEANAERRHQEVIEELQKQRSVS